MLHPTLSFLPLPKLRLGAALFATSALVALFAGCADSPPHHPRGQPEPPQPLLEGKADFFSNTVQAVAHVGRFGVPFRRTSGDAGDGDSGFGSEHRHSGMGMGMSGGMGRGEGGEHSGRHHRQEEAGADNAGEPRPTMRAMGGMPRQTLRIDFTNIGAEPVTFTIAELNSAIGNFQPQPEQLTLAAGTSGTLDPVSGDAGGLLEWLDVTLTLRRAGVSETHVLHLTRVPVAEAPPPSPQ